MTGCSAVLPEIAVAVHWAMNIETEEFMSLLNNCLYTPAKRSHTYLKGPLRSAAYLLVACYIFGQVRVGDECVYSLRLLCGDSLCGLAVVELETFSSV